MGLYTHNDKYYQGFCKDTWDHLDLSKTQETVRCKSIWSRLGLHGEGYLFAYMAIP